MRSTDMLAISDLFLFGQLKHDCRRPVDVDQRPVQFLLKRKFSLSTCNVDVLTQRYQPLCGWQILIHDAHADVCSCQPQEASNTKHESNVQPSDPKR